MEQTDDDPGHHPYEGPSPSTTPPSRYDPLYVEGLLVRAVRAENEANRALTRPTVPREVPESNGTLSYTTQADRISSALWTITTAGFVAAQTYSGIESLTVSSIIATYFAR